MEMTFNLQNYIQIIFDGVKHSTEGSPFESERRYGVVGNGVSHRMLGEIYQKL